ncbi:hypothetical protein H696_03161 [Fonticula alba]|uniref:EngB-type G domain-containing protein n=1 Tax=Fonticula alba TaxID=691883 RepID=A0A058Z959_FONAL|nr:hypothetical protein H696_03161 [Fonticula alba]KCV70810.1 hypothetical protein H696_03161 [Fonticula alba]|eukprot:XP_009495326.1 hypothetical protein H696_03161 [Fonticula alba]
MLARSALLSRTLIGTASAAARVPAMLATAPGPRCLGGLLAPRVGLAPGTFGATLATRDFSSARRKAGITRQFGDGSTPSRPRPSFSARIGQTRTSASKEIFQHQQRVQQASGMGRAGASAAASRKGKLLSIPAAVARTRRRREDAAAAAAAASGTAGPGSGGSSRTDREIMTLIRNQKVARFSVPDDAQLRGQTASVINRLMTPEDKSLQEMFRTGFSKVVFCNHPADFPYSDEQKRESPNPNKRRRRVGTEIAFLGRSNVGKSSLLNRLTGSTFAPVSDRPGETRTFNFYRVKGLEGIGPTKADQPENRAVLVDLPGYGFAFGRAARVHSWRRMMLEFAAFRPGLSRVFLLADARHGLKASDRDFIRRFENCPTPPPGWVPPRPVRPTVPPEPGTTITKEGDVWPPLLADTPLDAGALSDDDLESGPTIYKYNRAKFQVVLTKCDLVKERDLLQVAQSIEKELADYKYAVKEVMFVSSRTGAGVAQLRREAASCFGLRLVNPSGTSAKNTSAPGDHAQQPVVPVAPVPSSAEDTSAGPASPAPSARVLDPEVVERRKAKKKAKKANKKQDGLFVKYEYVSRKDLDKRGR